MDKHCDAVPAMFAMLPWPIPATGGLLVLLVASWTLAVVADSRTHALELSGTPRGIARGAAWRRVQSRSSMGCCVLAFAMLVCIGPLVL